ncbi:uncharacterized protein LOC132808879 [Hemiscyllium ocellatum]|uniref:uncharacterized protein LOC132808879 n=1 Tax=Hemiscyllium ocellatum TaxID=170820 RepID=UPI0029672D18|nr:uncharacterized protein LOC132808879 [Hemiscyllium ocellatum]
MSPVSGESLQLVHIQEDSLLLNEDAFRSCFLREDVKDGPVCLITIIGEERKGKSFLLNYLLRRLRHLECKDKGWMGKLNEILKGFEYRPGIHTTTKGVFIWSEPFLIDTEHGKMAVFLVDTEGCDGHERTKGLSVQLSALSMLLSSYMIFNVASKINRTDLEYLEMFLDMAEKVGGGLDLDPVQHLDILVRDWEGSENYGKDSGKEYLLEIEKKIHRLDSQYCVSLLEQLSMCECFLLPNPGEGIRKSTTGCWKDMREDFRNSLDDYFSTVLRSLPTGARTDNSGSVVSGLQVFERMQLFTKTIETYSQDITTQLQMVNAIQAMKLREKIRKDFQSFLHFSEVDDDDIYVILNISPMSMRDRLETKANELMEEFKQQLEVGEEQRERAVTELDNLLKEETERFCTAYTRQFHRAVCTLRDRLLQEFKDFIEQQEVDDDDIYVILNISPMSMRDRLETKANELMEEFKQQLEVGEEQRERAVTELDNLLKEETERFCTAYTRQFHRAVCTLRDRLLQEFKDFIEQQEVDDDDIYVILNISPMSMRDRLETKANELMEEFKQQLEVGEEQRERAVTELDNLLKEETERFCTAYTRQFHRAVCTLRDRLLQEFKDFIEQQEVDDDDIYVILNISPMSMRDRLETKANELMEEFKQQLEVGEEQRERAVTELDNLLKEETERFCTAYTRQFHRAVCTLRDRLLQEFKDFIEQQEVDDDDIYVILNISPMSMRDRLETKANELMEEFKQQLEVGEEQRERAVTELDKLLKKLIDKSCTAYTRQFHRAVCTLRDRLLQEFKGFIEQQEQVSSWLLIYVKTLLGQMRKLLEEKENELMETLWTTMRECEEERERAMAQLQSQLHMEKEIFCKKHSDNFWNGLKFGIMVGAVVLGAAVVLHVVPSDLVGGTVVAIFKRVAACINVGYIFRSDNTPCFGILGAFFWFSFVSFGNSPMNVRTGTRWHVTPRYNQRCYTTELGREVHRSPGMESF